MRRKRTQLRRSLSKYVPKTIKRIKRRVRSGLVELYRPIHAYRYRSYPKVLQTSIPKSGTHLLNQVLEGIGYHLYKNQPFNKYIVLDYNPTHILPHLSRVKQGEYFIEHLNWQEEVESLLLGEGFKVLFIYRDPRATAVSWSHHMAKEGLIYPLHDYYRGLPNLRERIVATLEGIQDRYSTNGLGMCPWPDLYDHFLPWKNSPLACAVSFEDLIGKTGGGSDGTQVRTIERILQYVGHKQSGETGRRLAKSVFNPTVSTFRKGQIRSWESEVDADDKALLNERLARQLVEWGYER